MSRESRIRMERMRSMHSSVRFFVERKVATIKSRSVSIALPRPGARCFRCFRVSLAMDSEVDLVDNRQTYPGGSPRADTGSGGVYTGALLILRVVDGRSMAMGLLLGLCLWRFALSRDRVGMLPEDRGRASTSRVLLVFTTY